MIHLHPIHLAGVVWDTMLENMERQGFSGEIDQYLAHLVRQEFERLTMPHNLEYQAEIVCFDLVRRAELRHDKHEWTKTVIPLAGVIWGMLEENMRRGVYFKNEVATYFADQVRRDAFAGGHAGTQPLKYPQRQGGWAN